MRTRKPLYIAVEDKNGFRSVEIIYRGKSFSALSQSVKKVKESAIHFVESSIDDEQMRLAAIKSLETLKD